MRAKYLFLTISVLSLGMIKNVLADDVYVDLSVLDSLENTSAPSMQQGPLFPIISSDSQTRPSKVAKTTLKAKKSTKSKSKLKIPAKKTVKVDSQKVEKAKSRPQENISEKKKTIETGPFKVAPAEPQQDKVQSAPSVPVKTETLPEQEKKVETSTPNTASVTPVVESQQVQSNAQSKTEIAATPVQNTSEDKKADNVSTLPSKDANSRQEQTTSSSVSSSDKVSAESKPSLLIDNKQGGEEAKPAAVQKSEISFSPEGDELTPAMQTEIDNIIGAFENAKENKIAIYSFNLDDGEDSFRKKRIALNRAIAVRSYLLAKGYKNFSIKVVNLTEANGMENAVRIEELK